MGLGLTAVVVPARVAVVWAQRRLMFGQRGRGNLRVSVALAPTLVFTLVLAHILHARFGIDSALMGALILYTVLNTMLPSLLLKGPFDVDPLDARPAPHPEDALPEPTAAPVAPPAR